MTSGQEMSELLAPAEGAAEAAAFLFSCQGIRCNGSAALDFCYVARGRLDGFWELSLRPWDTAAGGLILQEAGGTRTDFSGNPFSPCGQRGPGF